MPRTAIFVVLIALMPLAGCGGSSPGGKSLSQQQADAMKLSDAGQRARKLAQLAQKQQQAGDLLGVGASLSAARAAASEVKDPASRAAALIFVAGYFAKLEQSTDDIKAVLRDAGNAAEEVRDPDVKIRTLADLAAATGTHVKNATLAASYLKTAEKAAGELKDVVLQAVAWSRIAVAYQRLERSEDASRVIALAKEAATSATDARQKCDAQAEIGAALGRMKLAADADAAFAAAEEAALEISEADGRAYALLNLARKLSAAGKKEAAQTMLTRASAQADMVSDSSIREPLVTEIAAARKEL
jgi:hypothetical protein